MKRLLMLSVLTVLCALGRPAVAAARYTVVTVDPVRDRLELFLNDEAGAPFKSFKRLESWLLFRNRKLVFAMNAGMYHADFSPVGLLVQEGARTAPLNLDDGFGNFFLKPNGVFLLTKTGAKVIAADEYPALKRTVLLATQSGPLLLRHGEIHKAFNPASTSRHIRNGVGIVKGKAVFVISEQPVTFYEMAAFFRDKLHCRDALYFDGSVSSIYSAELGRHDTHSVMGPILAVVKKKK